MNGIEDKFLVDVLTAIVDNPQDIVIDRITDNMGILVTLTVHPSDVGKVIGRSGNTVNALRTLLRVVGMKNNARISLKINETNSSRPRLYPHDDALDKVPF